MSREKVYAFIDSQNLNLGVRNLGWEIDFKKLRVYLKNKYRIEKCFLFIGYIPDNKPLYKTLKDFGFDLVFKPTVGNGKGGVKGNIDAELVLHSAKIQFDNYDKAIVVSSDGDFYCLYEFLIEENKLTKIVIPNRKSESSLLKKFQKYKAFLDTEKTKLSKAKR